ncbi:uncharacterized protein K444DRAFT_639073 [Hyaloscypha bicolor E]|uniref:NB-ARC domain-containing protein n=1 Tax=Hyaloscypha bicolor E TaxID=1095630 RepID=A0A2J6TV62_9HELO|nr:uncharacterized protein K444DRAFT_639073 [Hyaloscypha bicolor E]PMD66895.1 hypothetical protein K444DRAFT_639073 [Hyaloscypha bicolor E]
MSRYTERPETLPNPLIVIPFSRDTDFVERGILDQIYQKCTVLGSRIALVGLGGIGFRDIANYIKIFGRLNPMANIFQLVYDWLCNDREGKWVLILDNVDYAGFLVEAPTGDQDRHTNSRGSEKVKRLVEYLLQCPHRSILIIIRSKSAALKVAEQGGIIIVELMNRADGLALFEKKLGWYDNGEDVNELAAVLEYMPLAIVQATAYISQRVPCYSVRYKKTSLLNCDGGQLRRDGEAKNSIIIIWQISFDNNDEDEGLQSSVNDGFEDDLLVLRNYSFISDNIDGITFEMYGLKGAFLRNLDAGLPIGEYKNWKRCRALFPYAQSVAVQKPKESDSLIDWALVLYKAVWYAWRMGKGVEAENLLVRVMKVRKKIFGNEYEDTLGGMAIAGLAYNLNGRKDNTEKLEVQVMETSKTKLGTSKTKLGVDYPDTLLSMANLVLMLWNQGRKTKLGVDYPDTLSSIANLTYKTKLGVDYPDILLSIANLVIYKTKLGVNYLSILLSMANLISKTKLGVNYPSILLSITNLVVIYRDQDRKTKLEIDYLDILLNIANLVVIYRNQNRKTKLGIDYLDILLNIANLVVIYRN